MNLYKNLALIDLLIKKIYLNLFYLKIFQYI